MKYVSLAEAAVQLRVPVGKLHRLCEQGRRRGAVRFSRVWALPEGIGRDDLPSGRKKPVPVDFSKRGA